MPSRLDKTKAKRIYNKLMTQATAMSPAMIEQLRLLYSLLSGQVESEDRSPLQRVLQGEDPSSVVSQIVQERN